jgi:hypothetical protein
MYQQKNKKLAFLLAMMLVLSIFAGCGGGAGEEEPGGETATIPVGIMLSFQVSVASYGSNASDGAVLAMKRSMPLVVY